MNIQQLMEGCKTIIADGSMGTYLEKKGYKGKTPELANLESPELIQEIHTEYIQAGAQIIVTNTFGANRLGLAKKGMASRLSEINSQAVKIAADSKKNFPDILIAGDIGPTGELIEPYGDLTPQQARDVFAEQAEILRQEGVDFIILETFQDLNEMKIAYSAVREIRGIFILPSFAFTAGRESRTLMGQSAEEIAGWAENESLQAIGINCGLKSAEMKTLAEKILNITDIKLWVKPNAGLPEIHEGKTVFPETPEEFSANCAYIAKKGAKFIGGCCGTTPEYISALVEKIDGNH